MYLHGETAQLLEGTAITDPYSGETGGVDWSTPTVVETWTGIAVAPKTSTESSEVTRTPLFAGLTILGVPVDSAVTAEHRVRVRGEDYEVEGDPANYHNPFTGWNPGKVVNLKRIEG